MAFASDSTTAPARPLLPLAFRPSAPVDDPRTPGELLAEIAAELERQAGVVPGNDTSELPPEPLLSTAGEAECTAPLLPLPAPLPSLQTALSRRPVIFGAVAVEEPGTAAEARTLHLRRQLEAAAEHGADLLSALGLPRLVGPDHIVVDPVAAGDALDLAIAALDDFDAPGEDLEDDEREDVGDDELSLGWREAVVQLDLGHARDDGEPTLGAPERHPSAWTMGTLHYEPADGSYRRIRNFASQASWAQGSRMDGEGESEAGYDLREGDGSRSGEDDDDGLYRGEGDKADDEPNLGASGGNGDQRWWSQGYAMSNDPEADPVDSVALVKTAAEWEATFARRPALHQWAARAREIRSRTRHVPMSYFDPDTATPIGPGMVAWAGPVRHPLCNVSPVAVRVVAADLSNLRELGA